MTTAAGRSGFRRALHELGRAQKTSRGAPAYSRVVNRPLGRVLAAAADVLGARPDHVTVLGACATFSAIATLTLVRATPATAALVAGLLLVGYALDAADGQLARLQGSGTAAGEWLDHVLDAVKLPALHLAVAVNWHRFEGARGAVLLVPLGWAVVASTQFFAVVLTDQLRRLHRGSTGPLLAGSGTSSVARSLAVAPTDYGVLCLSLGLAWWHQGFAWTYGLLLAATAAFLALALPRWHREAASASASACASPSASSSASSAAP